MHHGVSAYTGRRLPVARIRHCDRGVEEGHHRLPPGVVPSVDEHLEKFSAKKAGYSYHRVWWGTAGDNDNLLAQKYQAVLDQFTIQITHK